MMANESVEWITLHAEKGDHLAVEGDELRTPEAAAAWEPHAERWTKEAIHGVDVRRREDVGTIRTLGRRPLVPAPVGNPYWRSSRAGITHSTTSVECAESTPLSRLHDRIKSLKEIARDWRANPPKLARKTGPKPKNLDKQMNTAKRLVSSGMAKLPAATRAIEKHGKGNCASENAAITYVRKNM